MLACPTTIGGSIVCCAVLSQGPAPPANVQFQQHDRCCNVIWVELAKKEHYHLPGMFADPLGWQMCPCCWRTCQALMGDACYGMPRLRAAASNSHTLRPFYPDGPFVCDDAIKELLASRQNIDRSLLDPPSCVEFRAAQQLGKLSPVLDTTGTAALVCRHEFVAVAVNMFTTENFCYYDIMLKHVQDSFSKEPSRKLLCFFLDIACQFQGYWDRCLTLLQQYHDLCKHAYGMNVWLSCYARSPRSVGGCPAEPACID